MLCSYIRLNYIYIYGNKIDSDHFLSIYQFIYTCTMKGKFDKLAFDKYPIRHVMNINMEEKKRKVCNSPVGKMEKDSLLHVFYSSANDNNDEKEKKRSS